MNDPQAWTIIGVFAAAVLGGMTLMTTQFSRIIRAEVGGLAGRLDGKFDSVNARIDGLDSRLSRVESKVEDLDREVTNIARRLWDS